MQLMPAASKTKLTHKNIGAFFEVLGLIALLSVNYGAFQFMSDYNDLTSSVTQMEMNLRFDRLELELTNNRKIIAKHFPNLIKSRETLDKHKNDIEKSKSETMRELGWFLVIGNILIIIGKIIEDDVFVIFSKKP